MANPIIDEDGSPQHSWLGTDAKVVRHVHVFGSGQLAIATRVELARLGIHRDTDYHLRSLYPPLVIACSDFDGDDSFKDPARPFLEERPPVLFACLGTRTVRIGPLIEPRSACIVQRPGRSAGAESSWTRAYAAGLPADTGATSGGRVGSGGAGGFRYAQARPGGSGSTGVAESDPNRSFFARVGAVLIAGQAMNFLLSARNQCVLGRVVEFDPFAFESKTYRVLKVTQ